MPGNSASADQRDGSDVTIWIRSLETGDAEAAEQLWAYCFPRLLSYSRGKLPAGLRRVLDEEDVALSAFKSFCFGAAKGSLGQIQGRDELWKLLYCITARKATGEIRRETRQKRGGGKVSGESVFITADGGEVSSGLQNFPSAEPTPAELFEFTNQCEKLFDILDDDVLRAIAILRVEGYAVEEIASRVGCARRSVERRLNLIRTIWTRELDNSS